MEGLRYLLLEELYLKYSSRTGTSLKSFVVRIGRSATDLEFIIDLKIEINELQSRGLVTWTASSKQYSDWADAECKKYLGSESNPENFTLENIYVEVQLTATGFDYAGNVVAREIANKSILETNASTQQTNASIKALNTKTESFYNIQRNLTWAIVISSIVYTIISGISLFNSCNGSCKNIGQHHKSQDTSNQKKLQIQKPSLPVQSVRISLDSPLKKSSDTKLKK
jgi:intein/homing endonuclease